VPRAERKKRVPMLLEMVGIREWSNVRVKGYSKGMRQRLGIANALINEPDLVLLDEPTDGVDPVGRRDIRNILNELKRQGKTVFLNSHLLSELEMVCDTVAILVQGVVSAQGTIDELTSGSRRYEVEVGATNGVSTGESAQRITGAIKPITLLSSPEIAPPTARPDAGGASSTNAMMLRSATGQAIPVVIDGTSLRVATDDADAVQPLLDALRSAGLTIKAVRPVRESLEDLFMKAVIDPTTGQELKPGARMDRQPRGARRTTP
jgi:ABC-2 type transport system ATP-binding protein